jgi:hypothetical protein
MNLNVNRIGTIPHKCYIILQKIINNLKIICQTVEIEI